MRPPLAPLEPGWVIVDGSPVFHRYSLAAGPDAPPIVNVHGFGISGTYLEPTAARLATTHRVYVPDLPGMGRSIRPPKTLDIPGMARALVSYCDAVGVDRATFVGNSLGCPVIVELAASYPERIDRAVMVSPAGGQTNRPLPRALLQMMRDAPREPLAMLPIAMRDYLHFGVWRSLALFRAMTRYPTLERLPHLVVPTLVIVGNRDPLVRTDRAHVLSVLPHVDAVQVLGAHALNFSKPEVVAALVTAHHRGEPLQAASGPLRDVTVLEITPSEEEMARAEVRDLARSES
jgi:pimeloyl-ACP methyl ester carboxylesterase